MVCIMYKLVEYDYECIIWHGRGLLEETILNFVRRSH